MSISVLLADDHKMFLEGMKAILNQSDGIELKGTARDGREAVERAIELHPDVVLLDMTMPNMNGIQAAQEIHSCVPESRIIILSMHSDRSLIAESLKAGVCGYVLKECTSEELCLAIRTVMDGQTYLTPAVVSTIIADYLRLLAAEEETSSCPLSDRELEVLKLLARGSNSKQIAEELHISKNTVDTHRRHILDKLGCNSLAELTRYAIREGYIDLS